MTVPEFAIREYEERDWPQVEEMILQAENFGPNFLDHERKVVEMCERFPAFGKAFVAEGKDTRQLVGYATIQFRWRSIAILSLITHHGHLRQGIGRRMVERIKEEGEKHPEANVVRVDSGDFMAYAHRFYIACGFRVCGFVMHDISWFNHQVHFALPLKGMENDE
jgi:GNAT superfamily N-acetyltransferase